MVSIYYFMSPDFPFITNIFTHHLLVMFTENALQIFLCCIYLLQSFSVSPASVLFLERCPTFVILARYHGAIKSTCDQHVVCAL